MKVALISILTAGIAFSAATLMLWHKQARTYAAQLAAREAAWQKEKAELESALDQALQQARASALLAATPATTVPGLARLSPQEILLKLQALRGATGDDWARNVRQAVYWLELLAQSGPDALPAIAEFLGRYQDFDLDTSWFQGRSARDRLPLEFALPPSLRLGLFGVLRQIGGAGAEQVLAEALGKTGRGVEVAYLARLLQEQAPDSYRDLALAVAKALLANTAPLNSASPLDRNHRDYLYGVLALYGDRSYAAEAQAQLVRADSQVDRSALRYLQQSLGAQAVPIAVQAYQNPLLVTNAAAKEPLARLVLGFVGADAQANAFYQTAINDPVLTRSHRKNLIEDLNQDGFADTRNLGQSDLPLIQNRITLIEQLAPAAMDDANAAAFKEAYKDLINMRERIVQTIAPVPATGITPGQP